MARPADHEMAMMVRICRDLATLTPPGRRRVLAYIGARLESLPVITGVGGGVEGDSKEPEIFDDVPQMPSLAGAH